MTAIGLSNTAPNGNWELEPGFSYGLREGLKLTDYFTTNYGIELFIKRRG